MFYDKNRMKPIRSQARLLVAGRRRKWWTAHRGSAEERPQVEPVRAVSRRPEATSFGLPSFPGHSLSF